MQWEDQQFHKKFDIGPGTLHDAITHIISALRAWCDMLAQRDRRPPLDGTRTVAELTTLFNDAALELRSLALAHPLHESVSASRQGITYTFTRGAILTHVTTHGMHHRAQCLNMLRQLGVTPLPASAVVEWMTLVDFPQA